MRSRSKKPTRQAFLYHGLPTSPEQLLLALNPKDRTQERDRKGGKQDHEEAWLPEQTKVLRDTRDMRPGRPESPSPLLKEIQCSHLPAAQYSLGSHCNRAAFALPLAQLCKSSSETVR